MNVIEFGIDVGGARHRFGVMADALKDLDPVLKEFNVYKRARIADLFDSEGNGKWPARSEKSEDRGWARTIERAQEAPLSLLRKLGREHRRATKRRAKVFGGTSATELLHANRRRSAENTVARRAFVLEGFRQALATGQMDLAGFKSDDRRLQKSMRGLSSRLDRAHGRAQQRGKPLGAIPQTITSKIAKGLLTIDSSWDSPAVGALHDGATVGRGAKLPPRPFLEWDAADVEYLEVLFRARAMLAYRG